MAFTGKNIVPIVDGGAGLGSATKGWGGAFITNVTASSATEGGKLVLAANDGAVMASGHRLGVIEFKGAEDTSSTLTIGARIEALTDATWSASENGASLKMYTTDANASESLVLTLDSDRIATFTGNINSVNTTTSSATEGGEINLRSDDGAALGDDHRLGKIGFQAAEDGSSTIRQGASIQAFADAAWSAGENGTRLEFYINDGNNSVEKALTLDSDKLATFAGNVMVDAIKIEASNTTTSSASQGGKLNLISDDGAALGDDHQLGKIGFQAAEDGSGTTREGAKIRAVADAAWSDTVNDTRLEFYTMDGDNGSELSLTLDSDLLATFAGGITAVGRITGDGGFAGDVTGDVSGSSGSCTGQAATVATIAGLAPNTATTQATQGNITSCANLVTVGTIGTGVWQGTAVATDQQKHLAWFTLRGYGTGDGTNYEIPELMTDDNAPFEHNTSAGSDGLTAQTVQTMMRLGGVVAPRAGTLKKWYGWATTAGSSTANIGLFRVRPTRNDNSDLTPVLLDNVSYTALGNSKMEDFDETTFTDADIAVGDIIYTGIKCQSAKATYFSSTLEIEWD